MRLLIVIACLGFAASASSCKSHKRASKHKTKTERTAASSNSNTKGNAIRSKYASLLQVDEQEIKNVALYQFVDEWTGTPYRYGGTSKSGVDCSGFIGALYSNVYGKQIPRTTSEIERSSRPVSKSHLSEGDIVIFDIEGKKNAHVGVYLLNGHFVHASSSRGVVISELSNPYYQKAFSRGGKL